MGSKQKTENGYTYVDLEKGSSSGDAISLWVWFLIVFSFAFVILVSLWYYKFIPPNYFSTKISNLFRMKA